jgi:glycosyltransferase involved in cell wall biosynthesis
MKVLLIVDGTCPKPYDPGTFAAEGMGGTEATVIRIAEGLAATGLFNVLVEQHNRSVMYSNLEGFENNYRRACYVPPETADRADYVISLRYPPLLALMQKRFPNARHYLWNHDLLIPDYAQQMVELSNYTAVAVSNYHKTQMQTVLAPQGYTGQFPVKVVYNPIADDLVPDETPIDRNKLVWTSSPHKGLDYALAIFRNLRNFNPDFRLHIANPGYLPSSDTQDDGVVSLGSLRHSDVIKEVRNSLCLFYPNASFPETFGIVLAESNAVGVPVLTHPIGAATEVLYHPSETLDCRNPKSVIDRVMAWHSGNRPKVKANPKFRLSAVIQSWKRLFDV